MWDAIRELLGEGVTVLLTTQYLEEADELANQIVVVDHGRVIADGTPQSLKDAAKGAHLEVMLSAPHPDAVRTLAPLVAGEVSVSDDGRMSVGRRGIVDWFGDRGRAGARCGGCAGRQHRGAAAFVGRRVLLVDG